MSEGVIDCPKCGATNFDINITCDRCGVKLDSYEVEDTAVIPEPEYDKSGTIECFNCSTRNFAFKENCAKCGKSLELSRVSFNVITKSGDTKLILGEVVERYMAGYFNDDTKVKKSVLSMEWVPVIQHCELAPLLARHSEGKFNLDADTLREFAEERSRMNAVSKQFSQNHQSNDPTIHCPFCDEVNFSRKTVCTKCKKSLDGKIIQQEPPPVLTQPLTTSPTASLIVCNKCAQQISTRASVCPKCGTAAQEICRVCNASIPSESNSCPECGDPRPFQIRQPLTTTTEVKNRSTINKTRPQCELPYVANGKEMSFKDLYFSSSGRISRSTYWLKYYLPSWIIVFLAIWLDSVMIEVTEGLFITFVTWILLIIPSIMMNTKRCHDVGRNGFYQLILSIPLVCIWPAVVLSFAKGTTGNNKYGPDPLLVV